MKPPAQEAKDALQKLSANDNRLDSLSAQELGSLLTQYSRDGFLNMNSKERALTIAAEINSRRNEEIASRGVDLAKQALELSERGIRLNETGVKLTRCAMVLTGIAAVLGLLQAILAGYQIYGQATVNSIPAGRPVLKTPSKPVEKNE